MADRKTFVGTTDSPVKVQIDIHTLEAKGHIKWEDDLKCMSGVAHSKTLKDGTVYSICNTLAEKGSEKPIDLLVYKMSPANPLNRTIVARVPFSKFSYQHSFASTQEYIVVFEAPYYINFKPMDVIFKGAQLEDFLENNATGTTKIHIVKLSDGSVTSIESGVWNMVLHFGNSYM